MPEAYPKYCDSCGQLIVGRAPNARYCTDCIKAKKSGQPRKTYTSKFLENRCYDPECEGCKYYDETLNHCDYSRIVGTTRLAAHGGKPGINKPCQERVPKGGAEKCGTRRWKGLPLTANQCRTV